MRSIPLARAKAVGRQPPVDYPVLFGQRRLVSPQVQAAERQLDVLRHLVRTDWRSELDRARQIECVGDALEGDVRAAVARHCPTEQPKLNDLADRCRIEDGQERGDQRVF